MYQTITTNIMVNNVRETLKFYTEVLGFETVVSVPEDGETLNFAIVQKDQISLMFQEKNNLIAEYKTLATTEIKPAFTLFITVDSLSELHQQLQGKVVFAKELHQTFYGKDEFAIFDNNQNILTIASS